MASNKKEERTMAPTITLADFDRAVANSRRNLEALIAEQANAEMAALAAVTAQIAISESEQRRVDAAQRRQLAIDEFNANALAVAQLSFADFQERAQNLRAMARQAEQLHDAIVAGTMELERDAAATVKMLVDAMPEPSEDNASEALAAAAPNGLAISLPEWLKSLNQKRWLSWPGVNNWTLDQLARGLAAERLKRKR